MVLKWNIVHTAGCQGFSHMHVVAPSVFLFSTLPTVKRASHPPRSEHPRIISMRQGPVGILLVVTAPSSCEQRVFALVILCYSDSFRRYCLVSCIEITIRVMNCVERTQRIFIASCQALNFCCCSFSTLTIF